MNISLDGILTNIANFVLAILAWWAMFVVLFLGIGLVAWYFSIADSPFFLFGLWCFPLPFLVCI